MLLKMKTIYLLCLFLFIAVFSSCHTVEPIGPPETEPPEPPNPPEKVEITVTGIWGDPEFRKVEISSWYWGERSPGPIFTRVNEFTLSDTMVIRCRAIMSHARTLGYMRHNPIEPPLIAKVTSSETGDVQYIIFILDPFEFCVLPSLCINGGWYYVGVISQFKLELEYESTTEVIPSAVYIIPDTTRQELQISPNGDILTVEIMYKDQILKTLSITVKGE